MKKALSLLVTLMLLVSCATVALAEEYTGTATGFGGEVTVIITVEDGNITDCRIDAPDETPDVGGAAAEALSQSIVDNNGIIDGVTGASMTSAAVKAALQQAMEEAGMTQAVDIHMAPGMYTGQAYGFSCIDQITVHVTVSETTIESLEMDDTFLRDMDSYENPYMAQGAFDLLQGRILDNQSIGIDAVTGATGSSTGIKNAIRNALIEAYQAGGATPEEAEAAVNANFMSPSPKTSEAVELNCDIVVVGAGASGSIASLTAQQNGADVINVERTFRWGGQSMLTGGPKVFSPETTDETLDATVEEYNHVNDDARIGTDAVWNDPEYRAEHTDEFVDYNHEAYRSVIRASGSGALQLMANGVEFSQGIDFSKLEELPTPPVGGMPPMATELITADDVTSYTTGSNINYVVAEEGYAKVYDSFIAKGGRALLETAATGLLYDDDGRIAGITATADNGTNYRIIADKVILATGGFGANEERLDQYTPGGSAWIYYGWQNNVGDGINMALEAGAAPSHMDAYPMSHQRMGAEFVTAYPVETTADGTQCSSNDITVLLAVNPDGVYVNAEGIPFKSEEQRSAMGGFSGSMGSYYLGSTYFIAYSDSQIREYSENGIPDTTMGFQNVGLGVPANMPLGDWVYTVLEYAQSRGWAWKVSSLAEGDSVIGLPEGSLEAAYDADATELNNADAESYWIIQGTGLSISSCGGILVNDKIQAVRADGTVIDNLYVVGNDSFGNIMSTGAEYSIGGDAGMWCLGSGYIAGIDASAR